MRQLMGPFDVFDGRKPKGARLFATAILLLRVIVVSYGSAPQKQTGDLEATQRGLLIYFGTLFRCLAGFLPNLEQLL
jgi:hypothetical protein